MLKGREILSLPVITLDERKQVGEVKDILYEPLKGNILGYVIEQRGWLRDGRGFLHRDLVKRENDCLLISDVSVVRSLGDIPELSGATENDIRGLRVEDEGGRQVGVIQDVVLNGDSGEITGYELSDGIIQDLLDGRATIPISEISIDSDKVVIPADTLTDTWKGESL